MSVLTPRWRRLLAAASVAALVFAVVGRLVGPSDLWDHVQPRTVSYTTDILVNGRWILPHAWGDEPATKPPLYNWLAAPAVATLGFGSEIAHRLPSVVALALAWLVVVRVGRAIGVGLHGPDGAVLGWLAGMMAVANQAAFKLGFLARPDMLLALWLLLGWVAATTAVLARDRSPWRAAAFWACVAAAALTKGPPALMLPIYALLAGRVLGGRGGVAGGLGRGLGRGGLGWSWGLPLVLLVVGGWLYGVWRVDADHLQGLLRDELWGRVTGTGPEGGGRGPLDLLWGIPRMPAYAVTRFLPWSLAAVAAMAVLWRRDREHGRAHWRTLGRPGAMLQGAALFVLVVVAFFTLSSGKRADYAAPALLPGALLAAWWLAGTARGVVRGHPVLAPIAAGVVLATLMIVESREPGAPVRGFGAAITAFAHAGRAALETESRPIGLYRPGQTHLQALMGLAAPDDRDHVLALVDDGRPAWVLAGGFLDRRSTFDAWLVRKRPGTRVTAVAVSPVLPEAESWPIRVVLYAVEPPAGARSRRGLQD